MHYPHSWDELSVCDGLIILDFYLLLLKWKSGHLAEQRDAWPRWENRHCAGIC
jgi:hypothetical protein